MGFQKALMMSIAAAFHTLIERRLVHGKRAVISVVKLLSSSSPIREDNNIRLITQRLVFGAK